MKTVEDLTNDECFEIVWGLVEILWPNGDRESSWSPDTLDDIALLLDNYKLTPEK